MSDRSQSKEREDRRSVVLSLVPRSTPSRVLESLRAFLARRGIEVIVERRAGERRRGEDRRSDAAGVDVAQERRHIRSEGGRRIGEQRAELAPADPPPELPPEALDYADQIRFVKRRPAGLQTREDVETARLVTRLQAGERDAFDAIYERYFSRVYGYLRVALRDEHEAEDAAHEVFVTALQALPNYEIRGVPFRMWLFRIVRNYTLNHVRRHRRMEVMATDEVSRRVDEDRERRGLDDLGLGDDSDLVQLIRSLPLGQRQVLVLRYVMGFDVNEIAAILGRSPNAVSQIHRRAFTTLRSRLLAREVPEDREDLPMRRWAPGSSVTLSRRLALTY